jgi:hypothetical protein
VDGDLSDDIKDIIRGIAFLVIVLGAIILSACSDNLAVGNLNISPNDSLYIDFIVITDQDSSKHWYERTTTKGGILVGENYCYRHHNWEDVRKKSE